MKIIIKKYMLYRHSISNIFSKQFSTKLKPLTNLLAFEREKVLREMALPKTRPEPIIVKLNSPLFKSIFTPELNTLSSLFERYGYEIRIAGGAVRDLLMGIKPKDLDFATTATPTQMKAMFTSENVRMINDNGEKHGTITPRINDKENFEVTTLRIDVLCDGRHAEIQFTTDWMLDALRRDLTINSMFLDLDGSVYDFFYGYDDLTKRKVRFVGDAVTRIQEDYLRILRYFRFYGRICEKADDHEKGTLMAISENCKGLAQISGERIWVELKKILEGHFAGELLEKILDCGLARFIGLPEKCNIDELRTVWKRSQHLKLHSITLLSCLLNSTDDAVALNMRLKLSAYERDLALFIMEHRTPKLHQKSLMPYQQILLKSFGKKKAIQEYIIEVLKYNNSPHLEEFQNWTIPTFPINGSILKQNGVEVGRCMGFVLTELRNYWADNEYNLTTEEILKELPRILNLWDENRNNKKKKEN